MIKKTFAVSFIAVSLNFAVIAQKSNEYGVNVIDTKSEYEASVEEDSSKLLIDLQEIIPGIKLDIRYASEDNFLGKKVYNLAKAYLRRPAADSLKLVERELNQNGLGLKIFDGYRPYSITVIFYREYEDTTFVSSPWKGSRHNRGCAVDLTLYDLESGEELPLPTGYDDFTEKAHVSYLDLTEDKRKNRDYLIDVMKKFGFEVYDHEWWHFDFIEWRSYELLDISFEELEN
jgi:zinc D-Ala-D-Ala dipeptidase